MYRVPQLYAMHCYAISFFGSMRKHLSYISTIAGIVNPL